VQLEQSRALSGGIPAISDDRSQASPATIPMHHTQLSVPSRALSPSARQVAISSVLSVMLAATACASKTPGNGEDTLSSADQDAGGKATTGEARRLYVSIYSENEVSVVDATTNTVLEQIPVGAGPAILLETPDHSTLFTANWLDTSISAIDVATHAVTPLPLESRPWVITLSRDGGTLYAGLGSNQIAVIDTKTVTVTRTIPTPQLPESIVVSPDGKTLYVALFTDSTLEALSAETGEVVQPPILMGSIPAWAAISPDGRKVYALNFLSGDVSVLDTETWKVDATVPIETGSNPITGTTTPDGSLLAVTNFGNGGVVLVDTKTNEVTHRFHIDGRTVGVGFSPDGKRGYATDLGSASFAADPVSLVLNASFGSVTTVPGHVTVFDPVEGTILDQIEMGTGPTSVVVMDH
jgi:YVTN family beta-propeller protein